jgi:hypothetical protein
LIRRFIFLWFVSAPVTQCRLLVTNPSAAPVAALAGLFVGCAWLDGATPRLRIAPWLLDALALAVGVVGIVWFMRAGRFAWDFTVDGAQNWSYFAALRQAVVQNEVPYYMYTGQHGTERFVANVETTIVPHAVLLKAVDVSSFFVVHLVICAANGYVGLRRLKRELHLSAFCWSMFVVVFFFNGYITAQLSVIRTQWAALYLMPWLFVGCVRLAADDRSMKNAWALAMTLAAMLYLGAWHIFMWSVMFLLFLSLWSLRSMAFAIKALALTACLASARLVPALLTFGVGENNFVGGFDRLISYVKALAGEGVAPNEDLQWYDFDMYVGYVGFVLVCLGISPHRRSSSLGYVNKLLLPVAVLLVLSYGHVYERTLFRLPGFVSERYVSRWVIVPTLVLTLLGCLRLDRWLQTYTRWHRAQMVALLVAAWFLIVQLVLRAYYIRPETTGRGMVLARDALKHIPVEPAYWWSIWIGVAISASTLAWLCWQSLRASHAELPRYRFDR